MSTVKTVLDQGNGGNLGRVNSKLYDALEVLEAVNVAMAVATHALLPLADIDFHGKWRIHKALRALSIHDAARADVKLCEEVLKDMDT